MTPLKIKIITVIIRFVLGAAAIGLGIWYLTSSINGTSISYTSMSGFMNAIGGTDGNIANVNGCFLCVYISQLFNVIGNATEMFWDAIVGHLWLLMAIGFGIFLILHTMNHFFDALKKTAAYSADEQKLDFQKWFDKVWRTATRILIVGVLMGTVGMGGQQALRTISSIVITPVLYIGTELSMAATGAISAAQCNAITAASSGVLSPVLDNFMCVIGNLNTVMLAGAAGGFSMMNYAWMGLGGGAFTWIAGLSLVIMFLIIGFDLLFQVFSVLFKLVFLIIFLPVFLGAAAFEGVWKIASGLVGKAITMLVTSALRIIAITLKIVILYATIWFAADATLPGPIDKYTAVLPPLIEQVADRLTSPGMGKYLGANYNQNIKFLKGLFMAPRTVANAVKTAIFTA
ncbi:MAG: methionine gamma-lyase family protein, partial [Alphaproteobacteria bacterium]